MPLNETSSSAQSKPRNKAELVRRLFAQFVPEDKVLIMITADPDAMASAMALKRLLWRKVAGVTIAHHNEITRPDNLTMVRLLKIPLKSFKDIKPELFSKWVILDSQPQHSEQFPELPVHVIIDHHPLPPEKSRADFVDIRPQYGANSSIMCEYLRAAHIDPSPRLATALLYGIKSDTAAFQRQSLDEDLSAFRYLYPKADQAVLRNIQNSEMRLKDLEVVRRALDVYVVRRHCMYVHLGADQNPDTLVQVADFCLKVDAVDMSVVSGTYQDKLIIILRYGGYRGNVGKMASEAFGQLGSAGGHQAAARAEIPLEKLKEVLGTLKQNSIAEFIRDSVGLPSRQRNRKLTARYSSEMEP